MSRTIDQDMTTGLSIWHARGMAQGLNRFRNSDGSFKVWMHVLVLEPADHNGRIISASRINSSSRTLFLRFKTHSVYPWLFDVKRHSGETLEMLARLGAFKMLPRVWQEFPVPFRRSEFTPTYAVMGNHVGSTAASEALTRIRAKANISGSFEFLAYMQKYVLFPTKPNKWAPQGNTMPNVGLDIASLEVVTRVDSAHY